MPIIHGAVGPQRNFNGEDPELRAGVGGDLLTNIYGPYFETARSGQMFHATTAVGGVAPGTAIGTTAAFAMANPLGSNVNLSIIRVFLVYVSGTLGTGNVDYIAHNDPAQAALTGTAIPVVCGWLGGPKAVGKPLTTATVPASGIVFRPLAYLAPELATSVTAPQITIDIIDGAIMVDPGCAFSIQATAAAGTSPLVRYGIQWTEVPQ